MAPAINFYCSQDKFPPTLSSPQMESSHHFHFSQIFSSLYLKGIICFHFDIIYTEIVFFLATFLYSSESNVIFMDRPWTGIRNG